MRYFYIGLCLFMIVSNVIIAQEPSSKQKELISSKAIQDLRKGTLIIRFPSHRKKIEALETAASNNPARADIIKTHIADIIEERDRESTELRHALDSAYTFSKLLYMYDYDSRKLMDGQKSGFFLTPDQNVDPDIKLETDTYFVLSFGAAGESGVDAYVVLDQQMNQMNRPFPYYFKKNNFWNVLIGVFDSGIDRRAKPAKVVKRIQTAFEEFYRKNGSLDW